MTFEEFKTNHPNAISKPILAESVAEFTKAVAKLNKRAEKLGVEPVTVSYSTLRTTKHTVTNEYSLAFGETYVIDVIDVFLSKPTIGFDGWFIKGNIAHENGSVLLFGSNLSAYREVENTRCDHCHTKHQRTKQYVIVKNGEGEKVVGHSCLSDFVGGTGVSNAATLWKFIADLESLFNEELDLDDFGNYGANYLSTHALLEVAHDEIKANGYESTSGEFPTKIVVLSRAEGYTPKGHYTDILKDFEELSKDDDSDFANNLKVIVSGDKVHIKYAGIAIYVPEYINRAKAKKAAKEAEKKHGPSDFVGEVDTRHEFKDLKVTRINSFEGAYGTTYYIAFVDPNGNKVLWKGSTTKGIEQGDTVTLVAKIKSHDDHPRFGKQTVVNRPTIKEHVKGE